MTQLVSTRDSSATSLSYSDVLLSGLAPDRGLYTPVELPRLTLEELKELSALSYPDLYVRLKSLIVGTDMPTQVYVDIANDSFNETSFPGVESGNYVPVVQLASGQYLQNLSLGPTAAFKDMALQPLAREMDYVLRERGQKLRLLGATSGDTGSAAEAAIKGLGNLQLFMLSPHEGMSEFQRAQMGSLSGDNIHNISITGRFDDCQDLVKEIKLDPEFADLGAVNSINWGRISSQVPYYVSGYLQVVGDSVGQEIDVVVPTGNFGNILAGYFAKMMGVPIRRLIVATNENNVLHRLIQTGRYELQPAVVTSSPSMDISKASNYERLLYYLAGKDPTGVRAYMETFEKQGVVSLSDIGLSNDALKDAGFESGTSNHMSRIETIRSTYQQFGELIDPHTADGVYVAGHCRQEGVPILSMATALPVKFEDTIREAIGDIPPREERFVHLVAGGDGFEVMKPDSDILKRYIQKHTNL